MHHFANRNKPKFGVDEQGTSGLISPKDDGKQVEKLTDEQIAGNY